MIFNLVDNTILQSDIKFHNNKLLFAMFSLLIINNGNIRNRLISVNIKAIRTRELAIFRIIVHSFFLKGLLPSHLATLLKVSAFLEGNYNIFILKIN